MKKIVWTYWEDRPGVPTPPHILLCREVLRYQCKECEIRLVTPANVHQYLPDLDPRVWKITLSNKDQNSIAVRCDFIRAFLTERYGGLYVDSDCIALKDFSEAYRASEGKEFFAMRRTSAKSQHISIGFYGTEANGKVITEYADALRSLLGKKTHYQWAEVGSQLLTPIVDRNLDRVFLFREDQIHPVVAEKQQLLAATDIEVADLVQGDALCLMLFHRIFEQEVRGASLAGTSVHDLYCGKGLISRVLRTVYPKKEFQRHFSRTRNCARDKPKPERNAYLATRYETDKLIERIGYWVPPDECDYQAAITPRANLKIAAIVEDRLYQGLRYEAHMMLCTPSNWKTILQYGKPDMLLMESIWTTATGHWHMAQCPPASERNQLLEIISYAKQKGIPTVFWFTRGHVYHEHYKAFARHFDFVFCADPIEASKLRGEGLKAEVLLPCGQPAHVFDDKPRQISVLYDGWADLDKYGEKLVALKKLKPLGLKIIESRYQIFKRRIDALPEYKDQLLGCVSKQGRRVAITASKCYITFDKTLSTVTTQQWLTLDAVACGASVIHCGEIKIDDPRYSIVKKVHDEGELFESASLTAGMNCILDRGKISNCLTEANELSFSKRFSDLLTALY